MEGPRPDCVSRTPGYPPQRSPLTTLIALLSLLMPISSNAGGSLYFVHSDQNGTPTALTNESGTKVWSASHDPYGKATVDEDPDGDGEKVEFNIRYPGQYHDKETGLHYNYHRYYDPGTGRYLTSDPIGLKGGPNTYQYAKSNPIMFIDPYGLDPLCPGRRSVPDPDNPGQVYCVEDPFEDPNEMVDPTGGASVFTPSMNSQCVQCCFPEVFKECMKPSPGPQDVPRGGNRPATINHQVVNQIKKGGREALICTQTANIKCTTKCNTEICQTTPGGRNCDTSM